MSMGFPGLLAPTSSQQAPQFVVLSADVLAALYGQQLGALQLGGWPMQQLPQALIPPTQAAQALGPAPQQLGQLQQHTGPPASSLSSSQGTQASTGTAGRGRSLAARLSSPPAASSSRSLLQRLDVQQESNASQRRHRKGRPYHPYSPPDANPGPRQGRRSPPPPPPPTGGFLAV
ncbi:hypothetical protein EV714DRAFT_278581 [Schizophyllum commune]